MIVVSSRSCTYAKNASSRRCSSVMPSRASQKSFANSASREEDPSAARTDEERRSWKVTAPEEEHIDVHGMSVDAHVASSKQRAAGSKEQDAQGDRDQIGCASRCMRGAHGQVADC